MPGWFLSFNRALFLGAGTLFVVTGVGRLDVAGHQPPATTGAVLYATHCAACHGLSGTGQPAVFPALRGNAKLADLAFVVGKIRHGSGAMPAFAQLESAEIAGIAPYISTTWDNDFGAVAIEEVTGLLSGPGGAVVTPSEGRQPHYTGAQADDGRLRYLDKCASCHGADFVPDDFSPGLSGAAFEWTWRDRSVYDLFETIRTRMPPEQAGSLSPKEAIDIVAYLLKMNGFPAGSLPLAADSDALATMALKR